MTQVGLQGSGVMALVGQREALSHAYPANPRPALGKQVNLYDYRGAFP